MIARFDTIGDWHVTIAGANTLGRTLARQEKAAAYAASVRPILTEPRARGLSQRQIAAGAAERGIQTPTEGGKWAAGTVAKLLAGTAAKIANAQLQGYRRRGGRVLELNPVLASL